MLNAVNILLFVFIVLLEIDYVYTMRFYILLWVFHIGFEQNVKQNRGRAASMRFHLRFFVPFEFALLSTQKKKVKLHFLTSFSVAHLETWNHSSNHGAHSKHKHLNIICETRELSTWLPSSVLKWLNISHALDLKCSQVNQPNKKPVNALEATIEQ